MNLCAEERHTQRGPAIIVMRKTVSNRYYYVCISDKIFVHSTENSEAQAKPLPLLSVSDERYSSIVKRIGTGLMMIWAFRI